MLRRARERLTYSNVVATIALFAVLAGGVAVAAGLKKNSVGKKQLKKNAVVTKKIAGGAVTSDKLANGAVISDKLAAGAVTTSKIGESAVTGAQVDEASLGTVPQAQNAVSANDATTAAAAGSAQTAELAANASALGGSPLTGVRSTATETDTNADASLGTSYSTVITHDVTVPAGGASVVAIASIDIIASNNASQADCQIESGRNGIFTAITEQSFADFPLAANYDIQMPLAGIGNAVAGTQTLRVRCREDAADDLTFDRGDLLGLVFPTG